MKARKFIRGVGSVVKIVVLSVGSVVFSATTVRVVLAGVCLGCISYGAGCFYKPLAFLVPGVLVWFELIRGH